jgi:hypothetical protein
MLLRQGSGTESIRHVLPQSNRPHKHTYTRGCYRKLIIAMQRITRQPTDAGCECRSALSRPASTRIIFGVEPTSVCQAACLQLYMYWTLPASTGIVMRFQYRSKAGRVVSHPRQRSAWKISSTWNERERFIGDSGSILIESDAVRPTL